MCMIVTIGLLIAAGIGTFIYFKFYHNKPKWPGYEQAEKDRIERESNSVRKWKLQQEYWSNATEHPFNDYVPESFIMSSIDEDEDGTCYNVLHKDIKLDIVEKYCLQNNSTENFNRTALYNPYLYLVSSEYFDSLMDYNSTVWDPIEQNLSNLLDDQNNGTCYVYQPIERGDVDKESEMYTFYPTNCEEYVPSICSQLLRGTCSYRMNLRLKTTVAP